MLGEGSGRLLLSSESQGSTQVRMLGEEEKLGICQFSSILREILRDYLFLSFGSSYVCVVIIMHVSQCFITFSKTQLKSA